MPLSVSCLHRWGSQVPPLGFPTNLSSPGAKAGVAVFPLVVNLSMSATPVFWKSAQAPEPAQQSPANHLHTVRKCASITGGLTWQRLWDRSAKGREPIRRRRL